MIRVLTEVGRISGIAKNPSPTPIKIELVVVALIFAVCVLKFWA